MTDNNTNHVKIPFYKKASGDGKKIIVEYNTKVEVNNALNLLDKISERHTGDVYGVESAFS